MSKREELEAIETAYLDGIKSAFSGLTAALILDDWGARGNFDKSLIALAKAREIATAAVEKEIQPAP